MNWRLLDSPLLLQHAPLLNPVLPAEARMADNAYTKQLSGEARKEASINVMCHVLEAKLNGLRTLLSAAAAAQPALAAPRGPWAGPGAARSVAAAPC